jgi:hypothetical protein
MNQDIIKNLTSILGQFKHDKSTFEVFKDVIEICSISQHQEIFHFGVLPENDDYKALEKRYLEIIKKYHVWTKHTCISIMFDPFYCFLMFRTRKEDP